MKRGPRPERLVTGHRANQRQFVRARRPSQIFVTQSRSTPIGRRSQSAGFHGEWLELRQTSPKRLFRARRVGRLSSGRTGRVAVEAVRSMHRLLRNCVSSATLCLGTTATAVPAIAPIHPASLRALLLAFDRPSGIEPDTAASTWLCSGARPHVPIRSVLLQVLIAAGTGPAADPSREQPRPPQHPCMDAGGAVATALWGSYPLAGGMYGGMHGDGSIGSMPPMNPAGPKSAPLWPSTAAAFVNAAVSLSFLTLRPSMLVACLASRAGGSHIPLTSCR